MAVKNNWTAVGVVTTEPVLQKYGDEVVVAKTILTIDPINNGDKPTYLPVCAFNKKAHVLCAIAHKGSTIFAKGTINSSTSLTSIQGKTLVGVSFKITDFVVLKREPIKVDEQDFVEVVQLYDPEAFMEVEDDDK